MNCLRALLTFLNWALISSAELPSAIRESIFSDFVSTSKQIGSSPGAVTRKCGSPKAELTPQVNEPGVLAQIGVGSEQGQSFGLTQGAHSLMS